MVRPRIDQSLNRRPGEFAIRMTLEYERIEICKIFPGGDSKGSASRLDCHRHVQEWSSDNPCSTSSSACNTSDNVWEAVVKLPFVRIESQSRVHAAHRIVMTVIRTDCELCALR